MTIDEPLTKENQCPRMVEHVRCGVKWLKAYFAAPDKTRLRVLQLINSIPVSHAGESSAMELLELFPSNERGEG